jgi:hypothetical protein
MVVKGNADIVQLLADLQLPRASGDELTIGVAARLRETMQKLDALGARVNALNTAPPRPQPRGLFDRFRMVIKGQ